MRLVIDVRHHHPRIEELLMAVSSQVQTLLGKVQEQRDIVQALVDADKVRDQLLIDLQAKVDALGLSEDDKAAIQQAIDEVVEANAKLTQVTTENTPLAGAVPPASDPNGPVGAGTGATQPVPGGNPDPDAPVV